MWLFLIIKKTGILISGGNGFLAAMSDRGITLWKITDIAIVTGSPVIINTTIVVSCVIYKEHPGVVAFDLLTGTYLWMIRTPARLNSPIEVDGKIAYASSEIDPVFGIQSPGIYILDGFDLKFTKLSENVDCLGGEVKKPNSSTDSIKYIGQYDNTADCKLGCEAAFRNTTSFTYYDTTYVKPAWVQGCYCRTDGKWMSQPITGATSGFWEPPGVEHFFSWPTSMLYFNLLQKKKKKKKATTSNMQLKKQILGGPVL